MGFWNRKCFNAALSILAACASIWRFEVSILFIFFLTLHRHVSRAAAGFAVILTLCSIAADSYFWDCFVWPEAKVFWFNIVLNKSSEWGTKPWFWYFAIALPNAMLAAFPLAIKAIVSDRRARLYSLPALIYCLLFSLLPHKEVRFVFPVIPILNTVAALAKNKISRSILVGCFISSLIRVYISSLNYPGAHALIAVNNLATRPASVHFDAAAASTGITKFLETNPLLYYSKEEGLATRNANYKICEYREGLSGAVMTVYGYARMRLFRIETEPKLVILDVIGSSK